jgi:hypothetical protein
MFFFTRLKTHPLWLWGLKPSIIGGMAVFAASPLLIILPMVADAYDIVRMSKTLFVVLVGFVWSAATSAYLIARWTCALDQYDRLRKRRAAPGSKGSGLRRIFVIKPPEKPDTRATDAARDLLRIAVQYLESQRHEEALDAYRHALRTAMGNFQRTRQYGLLYYGLIAYRGIAACALQVGRNEEAAVAIETGLFHAETGLERWPGAPQLVEQQALLAAFKWKTGLDGTTYHPHDLGQWLGDDGLSPAIMATVATPPVSDFLRRRSGNFRFASSDFNEPITPQGIDTVTDPETRPPLSNGLPHPPIPPRLRELLKDYPEHLARIQDDLNNVVEDPFKSTPLFEQAIWALEGRTSAFIREAATELEAAQVSGDAAAIALAEAKASLMRRAADPNGGLKGLHELWDFFQLHRELLK